MTQVTSNRRAYPIAHYSRTQSGMNRATGRIATRGGKSGRNLFSHVMLKRGACSRCVQSRVASPAHCRVLQGMPAPSGGPVLTRARGPRSRRAGHLACGAARTWRERRGRPPVLTATSVSRRYALGTCPAIVASASPPAARCSGHPARPTCAAQRCRGDPSHRRRPASGRKPGRPRAERSADYAGRAEASAGPGSQGCRIDGGRRLVWPAPRRRGLSKRGLSRPKPSTRGTLVSQPDLQFPGLATAAAGTVSPVPAHEGHSYCAPPPPGTKLHAPAANSTPDSSTVASSIQPSLPFLSSAAHPFTTLMARPAPSCASCFASSPPVRSSGPPPSPARARTRPVEPLTFRRRSRPAPPWRTESSSRSAGRYSVVKHAPRAWTLPCPGEAGLGPMIAYLCRIPCGPVTTLV
ncbi:hypothetical protein HEP81_08039 (plasmid) [Streptomyces griseofuscus]|uniref:Uncharacterized protein n=1 Tax=Streptomyces griseofuscus TaxID=146922 RepID=A0A7H1QD87_9ACTN|nr:hypothetical protein HEP81_08039 [Streptomyces griseofuscus]